MQNGRAGVRKVDFTVSRFSSTFSLADFRLPVVSISLGLDTDVL